MLGFPLTLYMLTMIFGAPAVSSAESTYWFLWNPIVGWWVGELHILSVSLLIAGLSLLILGWKKVHKAYMGGGEFLRDGMYACVRHPQYLGILLFTFGMLIQYPTMLTLAMYVILVILYYRLARKEEQDMTRFYGDSYRRYMTSVPMLVPSLTSLRGMRLSGTLRVGAPERLIISGFGFIFVLWLTNTILNYIGVGHVTYPLFSMRLFSFGFDWYPWEIIIFSTIGIIVVGLAWLMEVTFQPPLWMHAALWGPLTLGLSLGMLPLLKGLSVALQFRLRSTEDEPKPGGG